MVTCTITDATTYACHGNGALELLLVSGCVLIVTIIVGFVIQFWPTTEE